MSTPQQTEICQTVFNKLLEKEWLSQDRTQQLYCDTRYITLKDVLTFAKEYVLVSSQVLDNVSSHLTKLLVLSREICKLESSITQHFSADDFATLGFGDIFTFLGEHISLLPTTWQDCFTVTDKVEKPLVKLLKTQFPYGLTLLEDDLIADFLTNLSKNGDHLSSSIVLFSSTLSDNKAEKGFSNTHVGTNDAVDCYLTLQCW
ncbi:hypothetical protein Tco_0351663 [Tanacetum coccineum]